MCSRPMKCGRWNKKKEKNLRTFLKQQEIYTWLIVWTAIWCTIFVSSRHSVRYTLIDSSKFAFGMHNDVIKFHLHCSSLLLAQTHIVISIVIFSAKRRETSNHNGTAGEGKTRKLFLNNNVRVLIIQYLRFCGLHWSRSTHTHQIRCRAVVARSQFHGKSEIRRRKIKQKQKQAREESRNRCRYSQSMAMGALSSMMIVVIDARCSLCVETAQ